MVNLFHIGYSQINNKINMDSLIFIKLGIIDNIKYECYFDDQYLFNLNRSCLLGFIFDLLVNLNED